MRGLGVFLLGTVLSFSQVLYAQQISESEAKDKALSFFNSRPATTNNGALKAPARGGADSNVQLAYKASDENNIFFYVYNNGNNNGYVIIGGDQRAKEILAYIPQGHFDYDKISENLKWWLSQYQNEINFAIAESVVSFGIKANNAIEGLPDIPEMITTKWGQGQYYNDAIPMIEGKHPITGCVPTAIAQIMNYWNYPACGLGSKSYDNYSADFENTVYDWDNMADIYNGNQSPEQIKAVSTLMYHVGVAMNASYSLWQTSVYDDFGYNYKTIEQLALENYFGYDSSSKSISRTGVIDEDWECIIYSELKAGRPLFYTGHNSNGQGHAFVCHGYSSSLNMFAFNWGWDGESDGFFSLSATNAVNGFNHNESIITRIMPKGYVSGNDIQFGDRFEYDGYCYYVFNPILKRAALTSNEDDASSSYITSTFYSGDVVIPEQVEYSGSSYKVTHIGEYAFSGNCLNYSPVQTISLPSNLLSVGAGAFFGCYNVISIDLPNKVSKLGICCFNSCQSLERFVVPENVTSLSDNCFAHCERLKDIVLHDNITSLDYNCFANCNSLTKISIPNGISQIGEIFWDNSSLVSVDLPETIENIHFSCFSSCPNLSVMCCRSNTVPVVSSQTFPKSIQFGALYVPRESVDLYKSAHYWNQWGQILALEDFEEDVFLGETFSFNELSYQILNGGVCAIGPNARSLNESKLSIPDSVVYNGRQYPVIGIGYRAFWSYPDEKVIVSVRLPETLKFISEGAFTNGRFDYINLPKGLIYLGYSAFSSCQSLKYIKIPSNIKTIPFNCFGNCINLELVDFEKASLTEIASYAFDNCSKLNNVVLPESVVRLGQYSFNNCDSLKRMVCLSPKVYNLEEYISNLNIDVVELGDGPKFTSHQSDGTLFVPTEYIDNYLGYDVWQEWGSIKQIVPSSDIQLSIDTINLYSNENYQLFATIGPDNATLKEINWLSSDESIATVNNNGVVFGLSEGSVTLYVQSMYYPDLIDSCIVTVEPKPELVLSMNDITASFVNKSTCVVYFTNNISIAALQFDVVLPSQLAYITEDDISLNSERFPDHTVSYKEKEDGSISFVIGSMSNTNIVGNNGEILSFKVFVKDSVETTANIQLKNILATTEGGKSYQIASSTSIAELVFPSFLLSYILDGEVYQNDSIVYGTTITPFKSPTKEGYTFSGWSEIPQTMPANDIEVTGSFSINSYIITYKVDGNVYKKDTLNYAAAITPIAAPTKDGYTFSGWSEIPQTMPANDVEVTGSFSINSYILTYKVDGTDYKKDTLNYATAITPLAEPTNEGYTFSGWSEIPQTMPANDVEVTGSFTVNMYLLTVLIDGEIYHSDSIAYGTRLMDYLDLIIQSGIDLSQWELYENNENITMPAHDITINAVLSSLKPILKVGDDSAIYDLTGKRISTDNVSTLPSGIYIKNGKKIIVQ